MVIDLISTEKRRLAKLIDFFNNTMDNTVQTFGDVWTRMEFQAASNESEGDSDGDGHSRY